MEKIDFKGIDVQAGMLVQPGSGLRPECFAAQARIGERDRVKREQLQVGIRLEEAGFLVERGFL